jgi:PPM family protein phosphatase
MKLTIEIVQLIGGRENQEDCISISCRSGDYTLNDNSQLSLRDLDAALISICDGMGGHEAGEVASELVSRNFISSFREYYIQNSDVIEALKFACLFSNQHLMDQIANQPTLHGMGTTLVGIILSEYSLNWISVGDSHLYLIRKGRLQKLNQDHSMVPVIEVLLTQGLISSADALSHPDRNALRSVINGEHISLIDYGIENFKLYKGDVLLLATDGIDVLNQASLLKSVKGNFWNMKHNPALNIQEQIKYLNLKNNDNATICVIEVE